MLIAPDRLQYLHYLGSLGPLVAAFSMRLHACGREGVTELVRQMCRWRIPATQSRRRALPFRSCRCRSPRRTPGVADPAARR
ncbi:MAG: hypothetical protein EOP32_37110 [Rhodococcus sp. (in: high G+C Gram-positive bacteria)]|nr:MAG: hypothetical protein EOP32_37110 [Rhodococcus sp. (in: high G+C Gram-positive bacteria)]